MKSKHIAGTFTKKKKCKPSFSTQHLLIFTLVTLCQQYNVKVWPKMAGIVTGVCSDIRAWPGREKEDMSEKRAYLGIKTADRIIEFECGSKADKQFWLEGIQYMLNCHAKVTC